MRQIVFRTLAGLIAASWVWAVSTQRPTLQVFLEQLAVMVVFVVFAVFGTSAADRVLKILGHKPKSTSDRDDVSSQELTGRDP
jgi:hypothetical protein